MLLARVMLQVRVRHERADRVEDHGGIGPGMIDARRVLVPERREGSFAVRVEGEDALSQQDQERQHEQGGIERE